MNINSISAQSYSDYDTNATACKYTDSNFVGYFDEVSCATSGVTYNGSTYSVNFQSWGDTDLTQEILELLKERYDFDNMTTEDMIAFYSDLSQHGIISGTRAVDAMLAFAGIGMGANDSITECNSLADLIAYYQSQQGSVDGLRNSYNFSTDGADFDYFNCLNMDSSFYSKMLSVLSALTN